MLVPGEASLALAHQTALRHRRRLTSVAAFSFDSHPGSASLFVRMRCKADPARALSVLTQFPECELDLPVQSASSAYRALQLSAGCTAVTPVSQCFLHGTTDQRMWLAELFDYTY